LTASTRGATLGTREIADDQGRTAVNQRGRSVGVAVVDDDLVAVVEQGGLRRLGRVLERSL
jgi:hypothetical protein